MHDPHSNFINRRTFLANTGISFGTTALLSAGRNE